MPVPCWGHWIGNGVRVHHIIREGNNGDKEHLGGKNVISKSKSLLTTPEEHVPKGRGHCGARGQQLLLWRKPQCCLVVGLLKKQDGFYSEAGRLFCFIALIYD